MKTPIFLVVLCLAVCWAQNNIVCKKGKLSKKINIGEGDSYSFKTQARATYSKNTKCYVTYKRKSSCPKMRFSCSEFSVNNKRKSCKGLDRMQIQTPGNKKSLYCQKKGPDVTTSEKYLRVSFLSDKKKHGSGAVCRMECVAGTTVAPITEVTGSPPACHCGLAQRRTKIVGGIETEVNEYPWQVALVYRWYSYTKPYCGGSLISDRWILSAGHCTEGAGDVDDWHAVLGEHDTKTSAETDHVNADIAIILDHPNYDSDTTNFDFTLIKMKTTIDFSLHPHIRPICLPTNAENSFSNFAATVTGWGRTSSGGAVSNTLMEVDVNIITNTECGNDYWYSPDDITEQMLCANLEGGGKDACQGDSGGPLVTSGSGNGITAGHNYELVGVVSWGIGCASAYYPGVYARVTKQLDWIEETTADGWSTCPRY